MPKGLKEKISNFDKTGKMKHPAAVFPLKSVPGQLDLRTARKAYSLLRKIIVQKDKLNSLLFKAIGHAK